MLERVIHIILISFSFSFTSIFLNLLSLFICCSLGLFHTSVYIWLSVCKQFSFLFHFIVLVSHTFFFVFTFWLWQSIYYEKKWNDSAWGSEWGWLPYERWGECESYTLNTRYLTMQIWVENIVDKKNSTIVRSFIPFEKKWTMHGK